ncbi:MAG TPA: hypothetical protein VIB39_04755 [Candidatus Angelobacter sp.]
MHSSGLVVALPFDKRRRRIDRRCFGSFFSKRGEIAAIQSKINMVVNQNDLLVKSAEEIKSDISQRDWSKQRQREMQREVAVEVMRLFGTMLRGASQLWEMTTYYDAVVAEKRGGATKEQAQKFEEEWQAAREETLTHVTTYWQLEEVCRLVFSEAFRSCMAAVKDEYSQLTASISAHKVDSTEKLGKGLNALIAKQDVLSNALRSELGF